MHRGIRRLLPVWTGYGVLIGILCFTGSIHAEVPKWHPSEAQQQGQAMAIGRQITKGSCTTAPQGFPDYVVLEKDARWVVRPLDEAWQLSKHDWWAFAFCLKPAASPSRTPASAGS
jgi:hypothetical protein